MTLAPIAIKMLDLINIGARNGDTVATPTDTSLFLTISNRLVAALNVATRVTGGQPSGKPYSNSFRKSVAQVLKDAQDAATDLGLNPDDLVTYDETTSKWRIA